MATEFLDSEGYPLVGESCNYQFCQERDFLPFKCRLCGKSHCLQHAEPGAHECSKQDATTAAEKEGIRALVCPLCLCAVRYIGDPAVPWAEHQKVCSRKPTEVPQCPVEGCTKKLTLSGSVNCGTCGRRLCLKHRFEDLHTCRRASTIAALAKRAPAPQAPAPPLSTAATAGSEVSPTSASHSTTASKATVVTRSALSALARQIGQGQSAETRDLCLKTLQKVCLNIMQQPTDPKFRSLKRSNDSLRNRLFQVNGGEAFLLAAGWEREGDALLVCPESVGTAIAAIALDCLNGALARVQAPAEPSPSPSPAAAASAAPAANASGVGELMGLSGPALAEGWSCAVCTLKNPSSNTVCEACGIPKA